MPPGDLFAWGFPRNPDNLANIAKMEPGDICLFYVHKPDGTTMAGQLGLDRNSPNKNRRRFRRRSGMTGPFCLTFCIAQSKSRLARSRLASVSMRQRRATDALAKFGSFEAWAVDFIQMHAASPLSPGEAVEYFARAARAEAGGSMPEVNYLFQPKSPKAGAATRSPSRRRHSRQAKIVGDIGEQAVIDHLKATLPVGRHESIRWVAQMGRRRGGTSSTCQMRWRQFQWR